MILRPLASLAAACFTDAKREPASDGPVTFRRDVAPLLRERCQGCHVEGGIAPNITPDEETGIGKWSEAAIIEAVHKFLTSRGGMDDFALAPHADGDKRILFTTQLAERVTNDRQGDVADLACDFALALHEAIGGKDGSWLTHTGIHIESRRQFLYQPPPPSDDPPFWISHRELTLVRRGWKQLRGTATPDTWEFSDLQF